MGASVIELPQFSGPSVQRWNVEPSDEQDARRGWDTAPVVRRWSYRPVIALTDQVFQELIWKLIANISPRFLSLVKGLEQEISLLKATETDEEEGPILPDQATMERAMSFLIRHAAEMDVRLSSKLPCPKILPGPEGSIDLHWKNDQRELLVNIPGSVGPITFYGDDFRETVIKGSVSANATHISILTWLAE